jgi:hypothetical protein
MIEDDVITRLVELHDHIQAPATPADEDALRGERLVRRRRTVSVATLAAAVVLTVGLVQASLLNDPSEPQPAPAPASPAPSDPVEPLRVKGDPFATEFNEIVAQVPDWSIADTQEIFHNGPCAGQWSSSDEGGSGGNFDVRTNGELGQVWGDMIWFPSAAQASAARDRLVRGLVSCEEVAWQAQPIARTGAVIAFSANGLIWVQQRGKRISTLSAVTNDGPPPLDVQVEIADLMSSSLGATP